MSTPKTKPRLRCTSIDFIKIECPRPIVPSLVPRLTQGITILIESSAVNDNVPKVSQIGERSL